MALVIIDMQDAFDNEAADVEEAVLEEIRRTKHNESIFVVYYEDENENREGILPSITHALKGRNNVHYVVKLHDDGAPELWEAVLSSSTGRFQKMRFCGVWTSMCVGRTFLTMCKFSKKAEPFEAIQPDTKMQLVAKACNDQSQKAHYGFLREVKRNRQANVSLI